MFSIKTNTAANSEATFILQYEDLIVRRRSKYQQVLNLNPGAVVQDLKVQVKVVEPQGVVKENASDFAVTEKLSDREVLFSYSPSVDQQREDSENGLARDLTVEYDVVHSSSGAGQFVVDSNCYFAQLFSPSSAALTAVPVDMVFVIDVSGSMGGRKIEQTRQALKSIINQLRPCDRFTMVTFSSSVRTWKETLVSVSEYRQQAVQFARGLVASGGTNFNSGLLTGASILKDHGKSEYVPLLVILTDGQPTVGERRENVIVQNAITALAGTAISLNCLGFGFDLNYGLLEKLAIKRNGIVRRIYEGEDVVEQLEGFFEEISSPLLRKISVSYSASVELITDTNFPIFFNGSEIVVAGKLNCTVNGSHTIIVIVNGTGVQQEIVFSSEIDIQEKIPVENKPSYIEKMMAYLMVKQLLTKLSLTDAPEEAASIRQSAVALALKYNFVTDLTSLIVIEAGAEEGEGKQLGGTPELGDRYQDTLQHQPIPLTQSPTSYLGFSAPFNAPMRPSTFTPPTTQPVPNVPLTVTPFMLPSARPTLPPLPSMPFTVPTSLTATSSFAASK